MHKRRHESGMAMVTVLMLTSVMLLLAGASTRLIIRSQKDTSEQFTAHAQAGNVAQAGLQDAIGWFKDSDRAQPVQAPVTASCADEGFNPVYSEDELESETIDEDTGIVRDYRISGNIYGRYIVPRNDCDSPKNQAVKDVSVQRGKTSASAIPNGTVWSIFSKGIVYIREDFTKNSDSYSFTLGPDEAPNRILSQASVQSEIVRIAMRAPTSPVSVTASSGGHTFGNRCHLIGDDNATSAINYFSGGSLPSASLITPNTLAMREANPERLTTEAFFGATQNELRGLSDRVYNNLGSIPERINFSITYLQGDFTFTPAKPLIGEGLLYVDGNLTLAASSNSLFTGIIYVNGQLNIGRDNSLSGAVIASRVNCNVTSGNTSLEYNHNVVRNTQNRLGLYRENNLSHTVIEVE